MELGSGVMKRVAVVYPYFAHYREAILKALLASRQNDYVLAGGLRDPYKSNIRAWVPAYSPQYAETSCRVILGRYLLQNGVLKLALRRDIQTIIFIGDAQHLTTWLAASVAKLSGKRVLFWTHGWTRPETGAKSFIRCAFYHLADGLLLYGNWAKQYGITKGFNADNLYVVYNSLDYENQKAIRQMVTDGELLKVRSALFEHPERPMLICTSRLTKVRGLGLLLDALSILQQKGQPMNLLLVGDGPEKSNLIQQAQDQGLTVKFYGECYEEQVLARLIMAANVTVAPGAVGLTAMHSLAYGTPVITHNDLEHQMPEWEAICEGYNGGFFKRDDSDDLANAILKWTKNGFTGSRMRANCFSLIEKYYNSRYQSEVIDAAVVGKPAMRIEWT
jgi:glycosyltransferase involved in cell wall biosynthesis